jgi:asparaginyl-tRNA synthetase
MASHNNLKIVDLYADPSKYVESNISIDGWVKLHRSSNKFCFLSINDGSCIKDLQIVIDFKKFLDDDLDKIKSIKSECSVSLVGAFVKSPGKGQDYELHAESISFIGKSDPESNPIPSKGKVTLEHLRTVPHMRARTKTFQAVMRIKSVLRWALTDLFHRENYVEVQVPLITDNECESGANPFYITTLFESKDQTKIPTIPDSSTIDFSKDFFGKPCYMTVSGQLHLETLVLGGVGSAWCMTTAFRAEPSLTPLHASEFWMAELEACFNDINSLMNINESCIKTCCKAVLEKCSDELEYLQSKYESDLIRRLEHCVNTSFIRTTHKTVVSMMLCDIEKGKVTIDPKKNIDNLSIFKEAPTFDGDLSRDHERYITDVLFDSTPVFVRKYPAKIKAFYMPKTNSPLNSDEVERVDNFDMLMPGIGEVIGGSMREMDHDTLLNRMVESNIDPKPLDFYLETRRHGTVPHGGSGIGLDRLMIFLTGLKNVRDMTPFPRTPDSCLN